MEIVQQSSRESTMEQLYMDNFEFYMVGRGSNNLRVALDLLHQRHRYVVGWSEDVHPHVPISVLILYSYRTLGKQEITPFPGSGMDSSEMHSIIHGWLSKTPYSSPPDIDGHTSKGWEICTPTEFLTHHLGDITPREVYDVWQKRCWETDIAYIVVPQWAQHHK